MRLFELILLFGLFSLIYLGCTQINIGNKKQRSPVGFFRYDLSFHDEHSDGCSLEIRSDIKFDTLYCEYETHDIRSTILGCKASRQKLSVTLRKRTAHYEKDFCKTVVENMSNSISKGGKSNVVSKESIRFDEYTGDCIAWLVSVDSLLYGNEFCMLYTGKRNRFIELDFLSEIIRKNSKDHSFFQPCLKEMAASVSFKCERVK